MVASKLAAGAPFEAAGRDDCPSARSAPNPSSPNCNTVFRIIFSALGPPVLLKEIEDLRLLNRDDRLMRGVLDFHIDRAQTVRFGFLDADARRVQRRVLIAAN